MFLTKEEIKALTGFHYPGKQRQWLSQRGYRFDIAATGTPVILKIHVEEILSGKFFKKKMSAMPDLSDKTLFG